MGKATSVNQGVRREPAGSGAETKTQTLSGRRAPGVARSAEGHHTRRVTVLSGHEEDTADAMSPFQGKEDGAGRTSERPGWSLPCPSAGPGVGTELGGGGAYRGALSTPMTRPRCHHPALRGTKLTGRCVCLLRSCGLKTPLSPRPLADPHAPAVSKSRPGRGRPAATRVCTAATVPHPRAPHGEAPRASQPRDPHTVWEEDPSPGAPGEASQKHREYF